MRPHDVEQLRAAGSLKWTRYPGEIGAWIAESDLGTAPAVTEALHAAVDRGLLGYLPDHLAARLGEATAARLARHHDWRVAPERVRPLPDVLTAVRVAVEHFCAPDAAVVVPTPAYMPFLHLPATLGRRLVEVPLDLSAGRWSYDLDALDGALTAHPGALLVLCNPHNPVGRVLDVDELTAIAEVVERRGARVLADEIHAPLVLGDRRHVSYASLSAATAAHTVTAVSASKAFNLAGLKCAQLVLSNDADAARWAEVGEETEMGTSTLGAVATLAAYEEGEEWLRGLLAQLEDHHRVLADAVAAMPDVRTTEVEGTYLALLDLRALTAQEGPAELLARRAGVRTVDGSECGVAGRGFARFNFALPRPVLVGALEAIAVATAAETPVRGAGHIDLPG